MVGLFQENGPCHVVEVAEGQIGTQAREWGWDRSSNVIYIDQPNMVGFSYDVLTNGSLDLLTSALDFPSTTAPSGQSANSFLNGTFSSNNSSATANTTEIAAHAIWHMLQGFLGVFPQYNPGTQPNSTQPGVVGINLFAESYGGKYGPAFAALWEQQNLLRSTGSIPRNKTLEIRLTSLGIMQGCVDDLIQGPFYPIFAYNNTYGIQAISLVDQQTAANSFLSADGCQQQIEACRNAVNVSDPLNDGDVATVDNICESARLNCNNNVIGPYQASGRNLYDIRQLNPDSFPPSAYLEYLNSAVVQAAIGTPVNYSEANSAVSKAFLQTGDYDRGGQIEDMAYLLALGVRVALIYGDSDYLCNWLGGEAVSFSVAAQSPSYSPFYSAGYAAIVVNDTYVGGAVRQFGNLSFSRIYDAGHLIPAYQPETAFTVFTRVIMGTDLSTGKPVNLTSFGTTGSANATHTNSGPPQSSPTCWVRNIGNTCTNDQKVMIRNNQGVIINGVLYDQASDWQAPAPSVVVQAGMPGTAPLAMTETTAPASKSSVTSSTTTSSNTLTGVYVATGTPSSSKKGASCRGRSLSKAMVTLAFTFVLSMVHDW